MHTGPRSTGPAARQTPSCSLQALSLIIGWMSFAYKARSKSEIRHGSGRRTLGRACNAPQPAVRGPVARLMKSHPLPDSVCFATDWVTFG